MDTVVLKFGGSSVADNEKLRIVANKIINFQEDNKNVIVVVSAQGKTTDRLIEEAKQLSLMPNKRELDMLLSTGEQVSAAKLSILLNELGYKAISLTWLQAQIYTDEKNQDAEIKNIDTSRIKEELEEGNIVIVTGFQGIDKRKNITTLGRDGSDTTAVAIAAKMKIDKCYIYSDVNGIYTQDPNKVKNAKKFNQISYKDMQNLSNKGSRVIHSKCIDIAEEYHITIIAKSTFDESEGTIITDNKL